MTTRSANRTGGLILTSLLWMTGFSFVASAPYGAHAEQHNPARAATFGYVANTDDNTISVIATNNNTVVATIPVGSRPFGVATTPDGTHAYVTNSNDNTVSVIDTARNEVVATVPVGAFPIGVAVTPDSTLPLQHNDPRHQPHAYVTNSNDKTVTVIDTANNKVVATIPVGAFPTGVAITPDGTHPPEPDDRRHPASAYVTNQLDDTVSVINTANNTVVATIPVEVDPAGVAITPDGTRAYVANTAGNDQTNQFDRTVSVIDTVRNTVVATILVGFGPNGVAVTPDGTRAYVTNTIDGTVSVIDTARNKLVNTIPVGAFPLAVAFATVTPSQPSNEQ